MMRILILTAGYPDNEGKKSLVYVHARNKVYVESGMDVIVLNFAAKVDYEIDGIKVICYNSFINYDDNQKNKFDILASHAPNIRNHYKFLKKYEKHFKHLVFFFHGHEILRINEFYPTPYEFVKKTSFFNKCFQAMYDNFKINMWKKYFSKLAYKSNFIFVSKWMQDAFLNSTQINYNALRNKMHIINNNIGYSFENQKYDYIRAKEYDFITVRSDLDGSKYCIDIINSLAKHNSNFKFLIIGIGKYFEVNPLSSNITLINKALNHDNLIEMFDLCKCALMLTRLDAQGVMSCELATYGLPLITSDIPVCREILDSFSNVAFISNNDTELNLEPLLTRLTAGVPYERNTKYYQCNTTNKEVELFKTLVN